MDGTIFIAIASPVISLIVVHMYRRRFRSLENDFSALRATFTEQQKLTGDAIAIADATLSDHSDALKRHAERIARISKGLPDLIRISAFIDQLETEIATDLERQASPSEEG